MLSIFFEVMVMMTRDVWKNEFESYFDDYYGDNDADIGFYIDVEN